MKTWWRKVFSLVLIVTFICHLLPLNTLASNDYAVSYKKPTPYEMDCPDVMAVLAAGQLEELVLSTERSEAELIQILKDNYILMSPIFIKALALEILNSFASDEQKNKAVTPSQLRTIAKLAFKKAQEPLDPATLENIFRQMETLASSATPSEAKNRSTYLIVKRTLDAIRKNTTNRDRIHEIYRKTISQIIARVGFTYAAESINQANQSIYSSSLLYTMTLISTLLSGGLYLFKNFVDTGLILAGSVNLIHSYFFIKNRFLSKGKLRNKLELLSLSEEIVGTEVDDIDLALIRNKIISNAHIIEDPIRLWQLGRAENPRLGPLSLSEFDTIKTLSDITLTDAAYFGNSDIFDLNAQYEKLNQIFQSSEAKKELQAMRTAGQALLKDPNEYTAKMRFARQVSLSIASLQTFLNLQTQELEQLSKTLQKLKSILVNLKNIPYANGGDISEQDILKGQIILKRFEAELKRLSDQAIQITALQNKITSSKNLLLQLSEFKEQVPQNALGWEEAAKTIIQKIDDIFVEFKI